MHQSSGTTAIFGIGLDDDYSDDDDSDDDDSTFKQISGEIAIRLTSFMITIYPPGGVPSLPNTHNIRQVLVKQHHHINPMASQPTYRNVMEALVIEALEHRLYELPIEHQTHCDLNDAIAYALNRLPAVYTTNEIMWTRQRDRLRKSMGDLITEAALWGLERACQPRSQLVS